MIEREDFWGHSSQTGCELQEFTSTICIASHTSHILQLWAEISSGFENNHLILLPSSGRCKKNLEITPQKINKLWVSLGLPKAVTEQESRELNSITLTLQ